MLLEEVLLLVLRLLMLLLLLKVVLIVSRGCRGTMISVRGHAVGRVRP